MKKTANIRQISPIITKNALKYTRFERTKMSKKKLGWGENMMEYSIKIFEKVFRQIFTQMSFFECKSGMSMSIVSKLCLVLEDTCLNLFNALSILEKWHSKPNNYWKIDILKILPLDLGSIECAPCPFLLDFHEKKLIFEVLCHIYNRWWHDATSGGLRTYMCLNNPHIRMIMRL